MLSPALAVSPSSIIHGHFIPPLRTFNKSAKSQFVVMWRDGRDIMVSLYYYFCFRSPSSPTWTGRKIIKRLPFHDYDKIYDNLPIFIEFVFDNPISPKFSWSSFVQFWSGMEGVVHVRYEDLQNDTGNEIKRIVFGLSVREIK